LGGTTKQTRGCARTVESNLAIDNAPKEVSWGICGRIHVGRRFIEMYERPPKNCINIKDDLPKAIFK
jgi:hypothetical protein